MRVGKHKRNTANAQDRTKRDRAGDSRRTKEISTSLWHMRMIGGILEIGRSGKGSARSRSEPRARKGKGKANIKGKGGKGRSLLELSYE